MSDNDFVSFEDDLDQEDLASHRAHRCTPQEARARLAAGNGLFLQGIHDHEMHSEDKREGLIRDGQHPFAVIVTCSDSRVQPVVSFSMCLGDLFMVRSIGNFIDRVEEADIFLNVRVLLSSCRTAAQAVEFCRTAPRMNGLNVIAADPTEAYVIEMTSDEIYVEKDEGRGVLFRTNHVVSDQLSHFNPPEENYPSTHKRYDRIAQMVEERYGSLRFQDLYRIMSDHTNEPNCICRHPHEGVPATTVSTTLCVVEDREVWTTLQNPCLALPHVQIGEPSAQ